MRLVLVTQQDSQLKLRRLADLIIILLTHRLESANKSDTKMQGSNLGTAPPTHTSAGGAFHPDRHGAPPPPAPPPEGIEVGKTKEQKFEEAGEIRDDRKTIEAGKSRREERDAIDEGRAEQGNIRKSGTNRQAWESEAADIGTGTLVSGQSFQMAEDTYR